MSRCGSSQRPSLGIELRVAFSGRQPGAVLGRRLLPELGPEELVDIGEKRLGGGQSLVTDDCPHADERYVGKPPRQDLRPAGQAGRRSSTAVDRAK